MNNFKEIEDEKPETEEEKDRFTTLLLAPLLLLVNLF
jgi:hypothetical protein